jgi:hypothetical protein
MFKVAICDDELNEAAVIKQLVEEFMNSYGILYNIQIFLSGFIICADMYFLYFIRFMEDNYQLKVKLELLEQQATLQYKYYLQQEKSIRNLIVYFMMLTSI